MCKIEDFYAGDIFLGERYFNPPPRAFILFDFEQMARVFLSRDCDYYYIYCY